MICTNDVEGRQGETTTTQEVGSVGYIEIVLFNIAVGKSSLLVSDSQDRRDH